MIDQHRRRLAVWLVASLPALPAFAQTAPAPDRELVIESPPTTLTDEFATLIGTVGLKTPVMVTEPVTLRDLLQQQYGVVQPAYIKAIRVANDDTSLDFSTSLQSGQELVLPPCPPLLQIGAVPTTVQSGDNFVSYWKAGGSSLPLGNVIGKISDNAGLSIKSPLEMGLLGSASDNVDLVGVLPIELQATESSSVNFSNLARVFNAERLRSLDDLKPDETVFVPTILSSAYSLPLDRKIANDPDAVTNARESASEAAGGSKVGDYQGLFFYGAVKTDDCKSDYSSFDEDYQNYLFRLLVENRAIGGNASFTPAAVMVLDSGLYDQVALPGNPEIRSQDPTITPLDSNGKNTKPYWPLDFFSERMHGTQVASLTIGGPLLAELLSAVAVRQKIFPVNIIDSHSGPAAYQGHAIIEDGKVPTATQERIDRYKIIKHINWIPAQVVNMSFGGRGDSELIPPGRLGAASDTLYVAAAGNDNTLLDNTDFYPARSGGRASPNILTVASVDSDGQLSWFSNSSIRFVDIAAPGCRVPVLSYDKGPPQGMVPTNESGTSFSAPQVSWLASMISSAIVSKDWHASSIKKRILASADIVPTLFGKVMDGRVLNPKKALSLMRDVVEVKSEGGPYLRRGLLTDDARSPSVYCDPAPVRTLSQLLKVVPGYDGQSMTDGWTWLYFGDQDGTIEAMSCKSRPFELRFKDAAVSDDAMTSADVTDIVFRW